MKSEIIYKNINGINVNNNSNQENNLADESQRTDWPKNKNRKDNNIHPKHSTN